MQNYEFFLTDSLEKVFPATRPRPAQLPYTLSALQGEIPALQLVHYKEKEVIDDFRFKVEVSGAPITPRLRNVELSPGEVLFLGRFDDNNITTDPGLFPDLLRPVENERIRPMPGQYRAVWIDFPLFDVPAGSYEITLRLSADASDALPNGMTLVNEHAAGQTCELRFALHVGAAALPRQTLRHTEWFHVDCLANYYGLEPYSEAHWQVIDHFMEPLAREYGVNMLLTPVFTPPLDTAVGHERTCVQLVEIFEEESDYRFDFAKLARWCALCKRHGIEYIEVSHLFTQWGAAATPAIYAQRGGQRQRIFGWDVPAASAQYGDFLQALLPQLRKALAECGYPDNTVYYHISDEPGQRHLEAYRLAHAQLGNALDGCNLMDALSDLDFYRQGLVDIPVVANDHFQPFADAGIQNLWVYHCCVQCYLVPNRHFGMPSARYRIMGVLMYVYDIEGYLQWGYNFYNAQYSLGTVDPYRDTCVGNAFPAGDAFIVYPGPDGKPLSSVRGEVLRHALEDLRALRLLEARIGRGKVLSLLEERFPGGMTFTHYPTDPDWLPNLRAHVNALLEEKS